MPSHELTPQDRRDAARKPGSRRRRRSPSAAPLALAVAAAALLAGSAAVWALADAGGPPERLMGLSTPLLADASHLLAAPNPTRTQIALARQDAQAALRSSPASGAAWGTLADVETLGNGRLSPAGVTYLQRSYDFEPQGPDISDWRMRFGFEHWGELSPELRQSVLAEFRPRWKDRPDLMEILAKSIRNPSGRIAVLLTMRAMEQTR